MTFRGTLRRCFVWLLCLSLCLGLAVPVLAEDNTGTEIRLLQTEGAVNVSSTSGKTYSTREDMRLYSGYVVSTEEASYAWITLDAEKAVKLDECSSLEVRRSGKSLELLLKSGEMYCDVTAPLKEDEKLNIRTSTMVTGVRGTIVYIQKISDDETHLGVLEGRAQGVAINPITGATRALMVRQGQIGVFKVYDADEAGEGADAWLLGMKVDDIPPFVQVQIAQDPAARVRVPKDLQKSLTEALQDLLKKQAETRQKLEEIEELKEEEVISKDPLWEGKQGGDTGSYTITWNIDGRTETTTCKAGAMPGHSAPEKAGYVFVGWSPELVPAEADAAYTAIYIPIDSIIVEPRPEPEPEPEPQNKYTITWLDADGTLLSTSSVPEGEPLAGYAPSIVEREGAEFVGWSDGTEEIYAPDELPAASGEATYKAVYEQVYTISTQEQLEGGTVTADKDTAAANETVTVTVQPNEGYGVKEIYAVYEIDGEETRLSLEEANGKYTFTMPAADVTVGAVMQQVYTISTPEQLEGGTVTADKDTAEEGEEVAVTVTVKSEEGYEVEEVYAVYEIDGEETRLILEEANGQYTFTMPAADVMVGVVLQQTFTITWLDEDETLLSTSNVIAGTSLADFAPEVSDKPGYEFIGWTNGDDTYAPEELPTATGNDTYSAVYEEITYDITLNAYELSGNETVLIEDRDVLVASEKNPAAADETVTITAPGYYIMELTVTDADGEPVDVTINDDETSYSFVMPASEVTVEAVVEVIYYSIQREMVPNEAEEGDNWFEISVNDEGTESATIGQEVTVRVYWTDGTYALDTVTVHKIDGETGEIGESIPVDQDQSGVVGPDDDGYFYRTYTFEMPASDVMVTANFIQRYYINYSDVSDQIVDYADVSVTVDDEPVTRAAKDDRVVMTLVPHTGVAIFMDNNPEVSGYDEEEDEEFTFSMDGGAGTYSFDMPAGSVEVSAELFPITITAENATITVSVEGTTLTAEDTAALLTDHDLTLTLNIVPDYGYFIQGYADISGIVPDNTDVTYADGNTDQNATYTFDISIVSYTDMVFTITAG